MTPSQPTPEAADPVDELLAGCLCAADPLAAIEAAAGAQPEVAAALRQRFEFLLRAGAVPAGAAPKRLGNFVLRERLGGGGMGIVHRATELPIGRDVALKLIRPEHLWFDGARKRFLREVEAVAALDHPGIVPIYSAGEHDGVPFCAMELVRGESLASVLARLRDGGAAPEAAALQQVGSWTDACFGVVRQVASALAHGHERGIVHRDVKPSNIMLGDDGRARLIDFGLARLASAESMTHTGVQPGSLAYMSPEQVRGEDVDERTDVWSLGVTLCELLTLQQPFLAATEAATRARILGTTALGSRGSRLPWDAATVVATAMAPERERRYASMGAFEADLCACLERRPILAQRPGPLLRGRRWMQRHPARAAIWLCAVLAFVVLPTVLLWQERTARDRIEQEAERARSAETVATQKALTSQRVVGFLQDLFYEAEPERARGNSVPVRVILDRGVQRIRTELVDEPAVRAELLDSMAKVYANLGLIAPARQLAEEALQLRELQLQQSGDALRSSRELLASIANWQGRDAEAEAMLQQILATLPASEAVAAAKCRIRLAHCAWRLGRQDDAERGFQQALSQLRGLLPPTDPTLLAAERSYARFLVARVDPHAARLLLADVGKRAGATLPEDHPDRIGIELERAVVELEDGAVDAAATRLRAAIAIAERVFDANHPMLATLRQQLALSLLQSDRFGEGLQVLEQVQAAFAATYAAPHLQLARAKSLESSFAVELGDVAPAEAAAVASIAMFEQLFPHGHLDFACVLANLARVETELGHLDNAEALAQRSVQMHRDLDQRRDDALVLPLCYLADVQALRNELGPAEQNAREAMQLATEGTPRAEPRTRAMAQTYLAEVLLLAGKAAEGEQQARSAGALWAPVSAVGSARARFVLGWALDHLGRFDEAERELRATLAALQQHYSPSHPLLGYAMGELGVVLARRGQLPAAAEQLQRAVDIRRDSCGRDNPLLELPLLNLGTVLQLQHREAEAVPIAFECLELVRKHGGKHNRLAPSVLLLLARSVPRLPGGEERNRQLASVRAAVDELLAPDFAHRAEIVQLLTAAK